MTITEDLKNVSEAALGKLAAQFGDLPRPLLAAIGAGDVAVERLVRLRDQLSDLWKDEREAAPGDTAAEEESSDEDGGSRLADATRRAQQIAEDVAHRLGDAVGEVPDKAQKLIADLPAKAQEVANSLSRENLKETVESYTKRVAEVYRELADRGGARVHDAEEAGKAAKSADKEADGKAGKEADGKEAADRKPAAKPTAPKAAARKAAPKRAAATASAKKPATRKPAAKKPAAEDGAAG